MSCKCQKCGKKYKMDLMISNKLWIEINPLKNKSSGLLCPTCIITKLEKTLGYSSFILIETP